MEKEFNDLMQKAAEIANENELVELTAKRVRNYLDTGEEEIDDINNALDWAQGPVFAKEKEVSWILIKITK